MRSFGYTLLLFTLLFLYTHALDNGLGHTPQMGYNSWYDVFMSPSEQTIKEVVAAMKSTGLYDAGYKYINLDDGMVSTRGSDGKLQPDPKFPSGFKALADYIHSEGMYFGVYTDRGPRTCGGRPAAQGNEKLDASTYAEWGVDYVKEDSCNAPQDHQTAYYQYSLMRDALNSTGRPIFFSLCGWNSWYAPVGRTLGNSWRTGPDDTNWPGILANIDIMAPLWPYSGPGGWNDPCLLLGRDSSGKEAITDQQGRAQFTMWAVMASPMLLSQNVRNLTKFQLETYLNSEVISVGQDILGRQGQRLVGGNLSPTSANPSLILDTCQAGSYQKWIWNSTAPLFLQNSETKLCANVDNCGTDIIGYPCVTSGGTCAGPNSYANEQFDLSNNMLKSLLGDNQCVTQFGIGNSVSLSTCTDAQNEMWQYNAADGTIRSPIGSQNCLSVSGNSGTRANIWGRPLSDGSWAIAFINADSVAVNMTCDSACLSVTNWDSTQKLKVRDLWMHTDLPETTTSVGIQVHNLQANGGIEFYKVTPVWA